MSTEKELAISHPGFWRATLPLSEQFVRTLNRTLERFARPMPSKVDPRRRGLVNEAGFRVFGAATSARTLPTELDRRMIESAWQEAVDHVRTMRQYGRTPIDSSPRSDELEEAIALAARIAMFFGAQQDAAFIVAPVFAGCGWITEACGDVLAGKTLFELKAGERAFRSIDLQQLLTYSALNFAAKRYDITSVGLVNPRQGTFTVVELDTLCVECAGTSAADVLDEIVQFVSAPLGGYA